MQKLKFSIGFFHSLLLVGFIVQRMRCGLNSFFTVYPHAGVDKLLIGKTKECLCKETILDFFLTAQDIKAVMLLVQYGVNVMLPRPEFLLLHALASLLEYLGFTFDLSPLVRGHFLGRLCTAVAADMLRLSTVRKNWAKFGCMSLFVTISTHLTK